MTLIIRYIKDQLKAFSTEIEKLHQIDFPYSDSAAALQEIENKFQGLTAGLNTITKDHDITTVRKYCDKVKNQINDYLPILGFILRSTNLRIAFEMYGPLSRLAKILLGTDAKLIISSEWEGSPFTFKKDSFLVGFVLVGFPATESSNPFLIPLAGHEFGHSFWYKSPFCFPAFQNKIQTSIENEVTKEDSLIKIKDIYKGQVYKLRNDLSEKPSDDDSQFSNEFVREIIDPVKSFVVQQLKETFCDFVGLALFGESFLHANAYLLSSNAFIERKGIYPNTLTRIRNLLSAAEAFKIKTPDKYLEIFADMNSPSDIKEKLLISMADTVVKGFINDLIHGVDASLKKASVEKTSDLKEITRIYDEYFKRVVPIEDAKSASDILNAGWRGYHDENLWLGPSTEHIKNSRTESLKELMLKSLEVFEYHQTIIEYGQEREKKKSLQSAEHQQTIFEYQKPADGKPL